jgi:hypothetical protein
MVNERHAIWTIPAIKFYTATTLPQTPYIGFNRGLTGKLVSCQIAATVTRRTSFSFNVTKLKTYYEEFCLLGYNAV